MREQPGRDSPAAETPTASILGAARPLALVAGALIALQSSQNLDIMKLGFLAVAILALAGSVRHAWRTRDSALVGAARPWLIASVIIGAIVGFSLPVALANGTPAGSWVRDAAAYMLVAAAPWLALDLGAAVSPRVATWATAIAGSFATVSFTVSWVQRRHMVDLPIDRLVLPSFALATAFFALAVARSICGGRDRFAWAAAAAAVIGLLLATGTRTTLALAAIPIVLLVDTVRTGGRGTLRTSLAPAIAPLVVMAVFVVPGMLGSLTAPPAGPTEVASPAPAGPTEVATPAPAGPNAVARLGTFAEVVAGSDVSLRDRWAQTVAAWDIFVSSPLVGRGLGVPIRWTPSNSTIVALTADTPFTVLAKFGLFGIVVWAALGWATILTLGRLRRPGPSGSAARSALLGLATGLVVLSPFGPQLEDKGTGLGLILVLGLAFAVIRSSERDEPGLPARG